MKIKISNAIHSTMIIAIMFIASSCTNRKPEDTKEVAEDHNEAKFDNSKNEKDAQFLVNAAEINLAEISLSQLAQQLGRASHVKELGKMMENEHKKSLDDLNLLAKTKNVSLPTSQTENGQDAYKKLNDKSGNDFDKAYSDMMVSGHKDAIALFETASTESTDPEIKSWATSTLPALRTHLDRALECQKKCEKM